ncbi:MAG: hypothetical protein JNK57_22240 [Planctomycetaceae bacterium]|nr:hypothetical protein [Planctomycetaceae bacterium]
MAKFADWRSGVVWGLWDGEDGFGGLVPAAAEGPPGTESLVGEDGVRPFGGLVGALPSAAEFFAAEFFDVLPIDLALLAGFGTLTGSRFGIWLVAERSTACSDSPHPA